MPFPLGREESVTAQTTKIPAYSALVIQALLPFSTHSPLLKTALVRICEGSEPAPGSDKQKDPALYSPLHNFGR